MGCEGVGGKRRPTRWSLGRPLRVVAGECRGLFAVWVLRNRGVDLNVGCCFQRLSEAGG